MTLDLRQHGACWGGLIGGAGYAASVAFSDGGFKNWNRGAFWKSVGVGAISGVVTAGIGDIFGATGGIAHELGRAFTHGVANGMIAGATGGNMMQSFASGALGSAAGHAFQAVGGEFAKSMVGTVGFSALAGGIGAELTGGEFWRSAATGATIGLLNAGADHVQKEWSKMSEHYRISKIINAIAKANDAGVGVIDLAKVFPGFKSSYFGTAELTAILSVEGVDVRICMDLVISADVQNKINSQFDKQYRYEPKGANYNNKVLMNGFWEYNNFTRAGYHKYSITTMQIFYPAKYSDLMNKYLFNH